MFKVTLKGLYGVVVVVLSLMVVAGDASAVSSVRLLAGLETQTLAFQGKSPESAVRARSDIQVRRLRTMLVSRLVDSDEYARRVKTMQQSGIIRSK